VENFKAKSREPQSLREKDIIKSIKKFINEYLAWFWQADSGSPEERQAELTSAFSHLDDGREVYIYESEWQRFFAAEDLHPYLRPTKSTSGRKPAEHWDTVLVELAGVMLARQMQSPDTTPTRTELAADAVSRAERKVGTGQTPQVDTVATKVSEIYKIRDAILEELENKGA
jgi:hypothetical protein